MLNFDLPHVSGVSNILGAYDAKTHWSEVTERVAAGESFIITKHGKPIGELRPIAETAGPRRADNIIFRERLLELRKGQTLAPLSLKDLKDEDYRY